MTNNTPGDDILDSRDVQERIEELEGELEQLALWPEGDFALYTDEEREAEVDDLTDTLRQYLEFKAEAEGVADEGWDDGIGFIHDSYFTEYVEELVKDIGDLPTNTPYYIVIDWDETAENVKQDYAEVTFAGESYWTRG